MITVNDLLNKILYHKAVPCDVCDKKALDIYTGFDLENRYVIVVDAYGLNSYLSSKIGVENIQKALEANEIATIFRWDSEYMQGYCAKCNKLYCNDHWTTCPTFDDGYFDKLIGWCPERHEQKLVD